MNRAFVVIFVSAVAYAIYAAVHKSLGLLTLAGIGAILLAMLLVTLGSREPSARKKRRDPDAADPADEPLVSLVILLSHPMPISEADIRTRLQLAFGETFGDQPNDRNLVKQFRTDMVGVQIHGWKYGIVSRAERYIRDEPPEIEKIDARLRQALRQHQAWLSVDAFGEASAVPQLAYPTMGRILAEFVDDSALAVYGTDTGKMMFVTPQTAELLRGGDPLAALELRDPPIYTIPNEDPRLQASVAEALRRWPEFVAAFERRQPGQGFSVKAPFRGESDSVEYMWLEVDRIADGKIAGRLSNSPAVRTDLKLGDNVEVDAGDVQDWLYEGARGIEGGFSMRVIRDVQER